MKIGELARVTGVSIETIRYYERSGVLPEAPRTEGNYRAYTGAHLERLSFVRHCRGLNMTLAEIRTLLQFKDAPHMPCGAVNALLDQHIGQVAQRIRELRQLEKQLKGLRQQCQTAVDTAHCGILSGLAQAARQGQATTRTAAQGFS